MKNVNNTVNNTKEVKDTKKISNTKMAAIITGAVSATLMMSSVLVFAIANHTTDNGKAVKPAASTTVTTTQAAVSEKDLSKSIKAASEAVKKSEAKAAAKKQTTKAEVKQEAPKTIETKASVLSVVAVPKADAGGNDNGKHPGESGYGCHSNAGEANS